jgi:hypothetical protein
MNRGVPRDATHPIWFSCIIGNGPPEEEADGVDQDYR